jgi:hypothetical protein
MKDHPGQVPYSDKANLMAARGQIGRGELLLDQDYKKGDVLKMAGWIKQTARGPLISIKEDTWKPDPNYRQNQQPTPSKNFDDLDSDVPF